MANKTVGVDVKYSVDKNSLNELRKQLIDLRMEAEKAKIGGSLTKGLEEASKAASKLGDILDKSWNSKLNQLDLSKVNNEIKTTYGSVEKLKQAFSNSGAAGATAYNNFAMSVLNTNTQLKKTSETLDKMAITFKNTVRYGISSAVFNNLSNSIQRAYNYAKELDTSLNDIRIVTGKSADEMDKFAIRANRVAKELGRSTKDFTNAALIYYQQGLGNEEAQARAEVTMKAANVTGQSGREVSEQLTAVWNGYKVTADEAELYVDKLAAVAATTASDLEELSTGMSKVASAASLMGVDIDQLNAQLATIVSVTRQAPESVGTALKTIYGRMSDIKAGLDDETTLGNYTAQMAQMGINVLNANGNLRDMGEVIEEIGGKWSTMSREEQVALSRTMAGTRQYNNLLSLFDNWDMYTDALQTSANAAGTLQKQQDIYMESTEAHLQKLSTEAERTYDILFDKDAVNGFADALTGVLNIFNNLLDGLGGGINDFVFFGSTIANIFNKQIGQSIERQIENVEAMKANISKEELQRQIIAAHSANGENVTNASALDMEASLLERTLSLQKYLTEEQSEQLTNETAKIGLLEQQIQGILQYRKIAKQYNIEEAETYDDWKENFQDRIDEEKVELQIEKDKAAILQESLEMYQERAEDQFKYDTQEEIDTRKGLITDSIKNMTQYNEKNLQTQQILQDIKAGNVISEEQIQYLLKLQSQSETEIINKVRELENGLQGVKDDEKYIVSDLEQERDLRKNNVELMQEQAERQARISQIVQGLSSTVSLLTSIVGIFKTLNDDSLTGVEKFERIITVLLTSLPLLINNFTAIKTLIPNLVVQFGLLTTGEIKAATAAGTLGTTIWTALAPLLPIILPIIGVLGILTAGIIAAANASQQEAKSLEEMRKAAEELNEQAKETKKTIDDLKNSLNGYDSAIKTLQSCTENTEDWNTALNNVNDTIMDILDKYPQLAKIEGLIKQDPNTGLLTIDKKIINDYESSLQKRYITQRVGSLAAYAQADQQEASSAEQRLLSNINSRLSPSVTVRNNQANILNGQSATTTRKILKDYFDTNQLRELGAVAGSEDLYNKKVKEFTDELVSAGKVTENQSKNWVSIMDEYREQIGKATKATSNAANEWDNATKLIASTALFPGATNTQKQIFGGTYQNTYEQERQKVDNLLRNGMSVFAGTGNKNYQSILEQLDAAMGGGVYSAAKRGNAVEGWDNDRSLWFLNRETGEEEQWGREKIIEVIASYNALQNAENKKAYEDATLILQKVAEAGSIDEDLADKVLNKTFDINQLTENEYNQIKENKDKITEALTDDEFAKLGWENAQQFKNNFEAELAQWEPETALENAKERFRAGLQAAGEQANATFGFNVQDFVDFGEYLADIADESEELADTMDENAKATAIVTQSFLRMNKGIESLAKNYEDWNSIIKSSTKESEEYWKALRGLQNALGDLFDLSKDTEKYLDADFFTEYAKEIEDAATGSEEAIESLRNLAANKILVNIAVENNLDDLEIQDLQNRLNQIQTEIPNFEIGADFNFDGLDQSEADFMQKCQDIINGAHMTAEQATAFLESIGFEPTFKMTESEHEVPKPITVTETEDQSYQKVIGQDANGNDITVPIEKKRTYSYVDGYTNVKEKYLIPSMTSDGSEPHPTLVSLTRKASGGMNNYSSRNKGGSSPSGGSSKKSGGGGGRSSKVKEPDVMKQITDESDRYHDINIELGNISTKLQRLDNQKKKLFGQDLINATNEEINLLNQQIEATNVKLGLMDEELEELKPKLLDKGFNLDASGVVTNYKDLIDAKIKSVKELIDAYNAMSAEEQEQAKQGIQDAQDDLKETIDIVNKYENLKYKEREDLINDRQKALDEIATRNIEKFNMEVEIRLDMAEAERDWNKFKREIIDGLDEEKQLARFIDARLDDFSSYYAGNGEGSIASLTKQVNSTLVELQKMDAGQANVYGNNRTQGLEDLKKWYTELMKNLEDVQSLEKEIHESYIKMQDQAQKKFDEQVETFELIGDLIDHDMKVIQLVYSEDSYSALDKYYQRQENNNNQQLDFYRRQVEFWKNQMDAAEKSSEAWENAKEKWEDAVKNWKDLIIDSIEDLQDRYLNTINNIFDKLNDNITNGLGLDYVNEQWTLINKNADQYLDSINALYETQALENKYLDAIDNTDSVGAQRQLKELMDAELADLRERDKLTQYDIERANKKYEIALKQIALQDAQQNKTKMRLRRDSQGNYRYEYTSDGNQIDQMQDEINSMYNSLYNFDKARYQENLGQIYDAWSEFQEKMAEAAQINDPQERAERELLLQEQYGELINGLVEQNAQVRTNLQESAFEDLSRLYDEDSKAYQDMVDMETDALMNQLIPQWESGVQQMADNFAGSEGFLGVCKQAFEELHNATNDYENKLDELESVAGEDFRQIYNGIDETDEITRDLLEDNKQLINSYKDELGAIGDVITKLDALKTKYNEVAEAAKKAVQEGYEYQSKSNKQAADAARAGATDGSPAHSPSRSSEGNTSDSNSDTKSGLAGVGDGNLIVGESATYTGKYYYDSYGTAPVGSRYSGVANGVVVDRITNNPYGIHIHSADGKFMDLGWIKKSQLSGYDTGGYTGTWGNDGRLALLHQKELVLNAKDTENMLNAVTIMRDITSVLGTSVLNRLASIAAAGANGINDNGTLNQQVHIDATFPGVTNSREIENALNNLVNMAAMRSNRKGN